ncbi:DNA methyltransferase [Chloracidobacterium thermophilum]|uniref:site-specific DNA-methyltransferase (cytosine-N(4)-specific) n=1 Tax=Chloracidobacterium thermophilum (strain B) TaxID=981222 RepID=G2LLN8_CHLTF|nr:DNA methylase [Chloracidobacterium thermophilum B]
MRDARQFSPQNNQMDDADEPVHNWYRFVLSFPPHLVRHYLHRFGVSEHHCVLDPFCGTGTTLVECKKLGIPSVGIESNPVAWFASRTKVDWRPDPDALSVHAEWVAGKTWAALRASGIADEAFGLFAATNGNRTPPPLELRELPPKQMELLLTNSISPLPLHKTLVLLEHLQADTDSRWRHHELLALARALVESISNLRFGPEVGVGAVKPDAPVVSSWLERVRCMAQDLRQMRGRDTPARVYLADARQLLDVLQPQSIDVVFTSPPYPNEKDYTRTTRLESVVLGFIRDRADLKALKRGLIRSNTRGVTSEDDDDSWVAACPRIQALVESIEARRLELGKTSGFERLYGRVTKLYFGGMVRHLSELRQVLRPGARLAYVVGDQASYLRVLIRTGQILAELAQDLGYEVESIDLFRTRLATATRELLREEVVVLHWPGARNAFGSTSKARSLPNARNGGVMTKEYASIVEHIFRENYKPGATEFSFTRADIVRAAQASGVELPKNLGDVIYSFRYRTPLPPSVSGTAPSGKAWMIQPAGRSRYRFVLVNADLARIVPNPNLTETKIPDATPGLVSRYALDDEQALLARVRYNRLIDMFTGAVCYSLQNHLRTTVPGIGQIETDELYVGVDRHGVHYVFPVQAKGSHPKGRQEQASLVQVEQDAAMCARKFPGLLCRPIVAQFIQPDLVALLMFGRTDSGEWVLMAEKHYRLTPADQVTPEDLQRYREPLEN